MEDESGSEEMDDEEGEEESDENLAEEVGSGDDSDSVDDDK